MFNKYKHITLIVVMALLAAMGYFVYEKFMVKKVPFSGHGGRVVGTAEQTTQSLVEQFCPAAKDLVKKEDRWLTQDGKWKSFTPSTANEVVSFLGAQWAGVKIGKIICLYQTNEAVSFPLAIEQLSSQPILEPNKLGWSALVGNRRFCKSASVADCAFFAEPQKDTSNIYKEIEYNPAAAKEGN